MTDRVESRSIVPESNNSCDVWSAISIATQQEAINRNRAIINNTYGSGLVGQAAMDRTTGAAQKKVDEQLAPCAEEFAKHGLVIQKETTRGPF
jgi:hypothetical protein